MKKIQFFYTFNDGPQKFADTQVSDENLESAQTLSDFATGKLSKKDRNNLVKISCCIEAESADDLPVWFINCNGKMWYENGVLNQ